MAVFVAHYRSPDAASERARGLFEFESSARLGSKANAHDARVRMLELYGADALSWNVTSIEHKKPGRAQDASDGQLELDFREPVPDAPRKRRRSTKRGVL